MHHPIRSFISRLAFGVCAALGGSAAYAQTSGDWESLYYQWEQDANNWFFAAAMIFFSIEIGRGLAQKTMTWNAAGDAVANFLTLAAHLLIVSVIGALYFISFYWVYENTPLPSLPHNLYGVAACIVLCDIAYYWEHRCVHRLGLGWATHSVHHSSPHFNISVAYRHGPLDALFAIPFHWPVVALGFNPFLVFFSIAVVQLYQTALHTEIIGKLPRWIEAVFNTPSHHRVHHGSNPQYIDKNYAGIFIIWDKLFGTFEEEREKVVYGVLPPIQSNNFFVVFFHGFIRLAKKIARADKLSNKFAYLYKGPEWSPPVKN